MVIPLENEKDVDGVTSTLLGSHKKHAPARYPTSQWRQFWVVLKRTLLFSRRDWVRIQFIYRILFETIIDKLLTN